MLNFTSAYPDHISTNVTHLKESLYSELHFLPMEQLELPFFFFNYTVLLVWHEQV